jgi:hypothetical protein
MKITGKITQKLIWIDVGPDECKGLKRGGALTLRTSSPFYSTDQHTPTQMVTAYTTFDETDGDFLEAVKEATGLEITEYDTNYTMQFCVDLMESKCSEDAAVYKLTEFVKIHFKPYNIDAANRAKEKNLKRLGWGDSS